MFDFDLYEYEQDEIAGVTLPRGTRRYTSHAPDTCARTWEAA